MAVESKHEVQISWTVLISTVGLIVLITGAFWALAFSPINDRLNALAVRDNDQRTEYSRNSDARREEIVEIRQELIRRRDGVFLGMAEYREFRESMLQRLDIIDKAITRIESSRPTTGELQAVSKGSEATATQLEIRVRSLEDYIRTKR